MSEIYSKRLIEVLNLVAADVDVQEAVFPNFVHIPDEVASEVAEVVEYASNEKDAVDAKIIKVLASIDEIFLKHAGQEEFWTIDSMRENSNWHDIRLMARKELARLKLPERVPDLFWLQYVQ